MENNQSVPGVMAVQSVGEGVSNAQGFAENEAVIRAVPRTHLRQMNFDPNVVIINALRGQKVVKQNRARIEKQRGELDMEKVDALGGRIAAFCHCNNKCPPDAGPNVAHQLEADTTEGEKLRTRLVSGARMLDAEGIVDAGHLSRVSNARGYGNLAGDLGLLGDFYTTHWERIQGKLPITREDVDRATTLSQRIYRLRSETSEELSEPEVLRRQAFVVLLDAWEEARTAMAVIRRKEKDIDELMPSLFSGRAPYGSKKEKEEEPAEPELSASPAPIAAQPAVPTAPTGPIGNMPASPFVK